MNDTGMTGQRLVLYTDGGSRARGRRYAAGAAILAEGGDTGSSGTQGVFIVSEKARYLGDVTNNQAEYLALIMGMEEAEAVRGTGELVCISDSQLMVRQLNGEYRVKDPDLRRLAVRVHELARGFRPVLFVHAGRDHPMLARADRLLNRVLDRKLAEHYIEPVRR